MVNLRRAKAWAKELEWQQRLLTPDVEMLATLIAEIERLRAELDKYRRKPGYHDVDEYYKDDDDGN